jgi:hypothetical protein
VVGALRTAVRLLRGGASWDETAAAVGAEIPATQAQQEPDENHHGARVRTRTARNAERVARGLAELPLRFLSDGSPNPDYRPETILDLNRPGDRLYDLLVRGVSVPVRHADSIRASIDADLDGIAPDDAFHHLYAAGEYRRLVKDHERSNSSVVRYRWETLQLGPTSDGQFVLTDSDIAFLRSYRTGKAGTGSWGNNPLTGVFRVDQTMPLYSRSGWLDPARGSFKVRSASADGARGLRIWFEPTGAPPHSAECQAVGWIPNSVIGPVLARMLVDAVSNAGAGAEFRFDHPVLRQDPVVAAKQAVADLERRHESTAVRLADPDLSERTIAALKRELTAVEQQLVEASAGLAAAHAAAEAGAATHDDLFDITDLARLAAVLDAAVPVAPRVAERAARLLRTMLNDARLTLDPSTASIHISATLTLPNERGVLSIPLCATVANQTSDPWIGGVAGMWWARRTVPFDQLMIERGLATTPGTATRWRAPIAQRLVTEAAFHGTPLRGPNLAALLVRCNDPIALGRIRDAIDGGDPGRQLRAMLFEGPDIRAGERWPPRASR